ncbi:MAG: hypothetical protein ACRDBL_11265 [Rhabdaerophilum sp.]
MAFWKKWFGTSGKAKQATAQAAAEADRARRIQQAALTNPADSDASRNAAERRLKKIGAFRGVSGQRSGTRGGGQLQQSQLLGG